MKSWAPRELVVLLCDVGFDPFDLGSRMTPPNLLEIAPGELQNGRLAMLGIAKMPRSLLTNGKEILSNWPAVGPLDPSSLPVQFY
jgi:hypothetical protein